MWAPNASLRDLKTLPSEDGREFTVKKLFDLDDEVEGLFYDGGARGIFRRCWVLPKIPDMECVTSEADLMLKLWPAGMLPCPP